MKFLSLQPFVPSGINFEASKQFFVELGFTVTWNDGDYTAFKRDASKFILQNFDNKEFAENFMITVGVDNADAQERSSAKENTREIWYPYR